MLSLKQHNLPQVGNALKRWYFLIKNDAETLAELRRLGLGLLVCLSLFYAATSLLLVPKEKELEQKKAVKLEQQSTTPAQVDQVLASRQAQLRKEKLLLEEQNGILVLKKRFLEEQWRMWGDAERFTKVIFTLLPSAPLNIEKSLKQMSQLEKRSQQGFTIHSVNLTGDVAFHDLFAYLQYIESQAEVSIIENLTIERLPVAGYEKPADVHFNVVVGRMTYEGLS